ncbi:MAG: urea ABC transporter ATP-binding subunit UrtE [Akkermansiaceae bacterium]|jgi:urea transport system ATP-binding protein|tara:strand:+ start:9828 stop:10532 length:705 start_codon:yes stop_codon:yes gene_type:complete
MTNLLELRAIEAGYDQSAILRGVDLEIPPKSVVSLLGRNGVGKTTTLKTIMGLVSATAGEINLDGQPLGKMKPENRARTGLGYVPQGRDIFSSMTVWENLKVSLSIYGKESADRLDEVYQLFPVLKEMLHRKGGVLSGGQQQQLAIGRALLTRPKVLILDEPTEGIQPSIIDQIEDALIYLKKTHDMSILLVEQYLDFAKAVSDKFYIMDRGTILTSGPIADLSEDLITKHLTV